MCVYKSSLLRRAVRYIFFRWGGVNAPNRTICKIVPICRVYCPHPLNLPLFFWSPFTHSSTTVVLLWNGVHLATWTLHIHIRVRIAIQYPKRCLNVHPNSLILVKIRGFHRDLSITDHVIPIFLAAQNYIAEIVDSKALKFLLFNLLLSQWKKVSSASLIDASS